MTLVHEPPALAAHPPAHNEPPRRSNTLLGYLRTTSHKDIAVMYFLTSFAFFAFAGILALMMRAELARPGLQFLSNEQYNQLFTMHGTLMLFMFATPLAFGFANYLDPAADRRAGRRVPAAERAVVLAVSCSAA